MTSKLHERSPRRGTAAVAMIIVMVLIGLIVTGLVIGGGRDQDLSIRRLESTRAFYASEAATNMAVKELVDGVDRDGDGTIGTISDDSNTGTDPTINSGMRMWATKNVAGSVTTVTARGQNPSTARAIQTALTGAGGSSGQVVYWSRSGTAVPYYSTWNGSSWSAATALPTLAATGYWFQAANNAAGTETTLAATDSNSTIKATINASGTFAAQTTMVANSGFTTVRKFGVAYEQMSGDCMVAYSTGFGRRVEYRVGTAGTFASAGTATTTSAIAMDCVRLMAKPSSDELTLLCSDYNSDLQARVWSGSSWGSTATLSTNVQNQFEESFAGAYEVPSGDGLVVYSNGGASTPYYRTYTGGAWSAQTSMTACSSVPQYIHMAAKPASNTIVCGIIDDTMHLRMYVWNGSSWASNLEICTNVGYTDRRPFDVAYTPDGSKALVVYSDNTNVPKYRTYNGTSWSSATSMTDIGHKPQWVQVYPGASAGEMFVAIADAGLDLNVWKWDGSAMGAVSVLESSLGGSNTTEQFWLSTATGGTPTITGWAHVAP